MAYRVIREGLPGSDLQGGAGESSTLGLGPYQDVWSRSGSKYRIRAIVLLAVNLVLFAGVGSFAYWLRSGLRFAPAHAGYVDELKQTFFSVPFGDRDHSGASLGSFLLEPISVQEVAIQPWIVGLLMATLIAVPILVSLLYRFWSCLPFIAMVAFLSVMPWLAVTLVISCSLASLPRLRTRFRFTSALLGLIPVVVYLTLAWRGTAEIVVGEIDPVDRIKFVVPWVLAVVSAAGVFAIVLGIAKVVDYRPGAIAPLLAVMLALPVLLFEFHVGRDELYYRLLRGLEAAHFLDVDASADLNRAVLAAWERHPPPRPSRQAIRETVELRWMFQLNAELEPSRSVLSQHQAALTDRCDRFLQNFPTSLYAPNVLMIKARALDTRVDPTEFRRTKWIRFYDTFPSPASRHTWSMLAAIESNATVKATALSRLALLDARDGEVDRALDKLNAVVALLGTSAPDGLLSDRWSSKPPDAIERDLSFEVQDTWLAAHWLRDLLISNRDPIYGYDPIAGPRRSKQEFRFGFLDVNPRGERYIENLRELLAWYPNCQIADNLELEIAKASATDTLRIARLESCVARFGDRDAMPETLFRLGLAYLDDGQARRGEAALNRVLRDFSDSIWTHEATIRLSVPVVPSSRAFQASTDSAREGA